MVAKVGERDSTEPVAIATANIHTKGNNERHTLTSRPHGQRGHSQTVVKQKYTRFSCECGRSRNVFIGRRKRTQRLTSLVIGKELSRCSCIRTRSGVCI